MSKFNIGIKDVISYFCARIAIATAFFETDGFEFKAILGKEKHVVAYWSGEKIKITPHLTDGRLRTIASMIKYECKIARIPCS